MMSSDLPVVDIFNEIDTSDFCFSADEQPWMSEVFEALSESQLSQDDLLTDAVSEFMKYKPEDTDPSSSGVHEANIDGGLVGDEVEIKASLGCGSPPLVLDTYTKDSSQSSGCGSSVDSSGTPSPNDSSIIKADSPSSQTSQIITDPKFIGVNSALRKSGFETSPGPIMTRLKLDRPNQIQLKTHHGIFRNTTSLTQPSNNRVHFIVRTGPSVNSPNKNRELTFSSFRRIQTFSNPRSSSANESKVSHDCLPTPIMNKGAGGVVTFTKNTGSAFRHCSQSPNNCSNSSSDSDMREACEDEFMQSSLLDHIPGTGVSGTYDAPNSIQSYSRTKNSSEFAKNCGAFTRCGSPASRAPGISDMSYDIGSESDYLRSSRINSHQPLFRSQMNSRLRSPTGTDRAEVSQSGVLILTDEEKRTLLAEGYSIPSRLPLSKQEERNLKKVRRKIKNKISAQESRRKKKEYLEALERKVNVYSQENMDLKRRVDGLESTNRSLLGQLRLLQQLINKSKTNSSNSTTETYKSSGYTGSRTNSNIGGSSTGNGGGSASTCLMVFALCFAALLVGQPSSMQNQSSIVSGLTAGPVQHSFLNHLIKQGPGGLVSGSLSQIGYSWSKANNRESRAANLRHGRAASRLTWQNSRPNWSEVNSNARHNERVRRAHWRYMLSAHRHELRQVPDSQVDHAASPPASRSVLLGSPNEIEECAVTPRTFWSYIFGSSSETPAICKQAEYANFEMVNMDVDVANSEVGSIAELLEFNSVGFNLTNDTRTKDLASSFVDVTFPEAATNITLAFLTQSFSAS
ncbi:unnamed protein product [Calicophoron daubneyi]|uniref:BZIP domain-containing protein n=1 Tax=Calicophoron daubneyi TaxID=300641 RepID=A0AAV2T305_CALDB